MGRNREVNTEMNLAAEPELVSTGFQFVEGPVWVDAPSSLLAAAGVQTDALIFSDIPASRLYWLAQRRSGVLHEPTGQSNGNALDRAGMLISCEHEGRRLSRLDGSGGVQLVVDSYQGKRLNSPNDVAVRSDGLIFFTDPPYGVDESDRELGFQGVYCVAAESTEPKLLIDNFDKPNGLAFSNDEQLLYIADTELGRLSAFSVASDGELSDERVFCWCERPDGICVDDAGHVWVACMEGVEIFDRDGRRIEFISLPERPANIAFGDGDRRTLYICARTSIYSLRTSVAGADLRSDRGEAEALCS